MNHLRIFLSHCISDSPERPQEFRDSADDLARLEELGDRLEHEGFRVFEYRHFTRESRSDDLLEKISRQIALADVLILRQ